MSPAMSTFHFNVPGIGWLDVIADTEAAANAELLYRLGLQELPEGTVCSEEIPCSAT